MLLLSCQVIQIIQIGSCDGCACGVLPPAHISSKGPEVVRVRNVSMMITGAFILIHLGEPAAEKYIVSSWNVVRKGARLK